MKTLMIDDLDVELLISGTEILQPESDEAYDRRDALVQRLREFSAPMGKAAFECDELDLELMHDAAQTLSPADGDTTAGALNALELQTAALLMDSEESGIET